MFLVLLNAAVAAGPNGQPLPSKYDLIANVVHEGKAGQQTSGAPYKVHIQRSVEKTWYEVQVRGQTKLKPWVQGFLCRQNRCSVEKTCEV
jgi:hypothetical protein